jgi:plastocyanin
MNRSTRLLPAALLLVGTLAACAPAGDETAASALPPSSVAMTSEPMGGMSMTPAPTATASSAAGASTDPMASHDMGDMGGDTVTVDIENFAFVEDEIEISIGDTVEWVNGDATRHTITSGSDDTPDGAFDSGNVEAGGMFSFTFTEAGAFAYFCDIHPTMTGTVVVSP